VDGLHVFTGTKCPGHLKTSEPAVWRVIVWLFSFYN
jgi:hypothetical protein